MQEKRRHQRIRFVKPPAIAIGFGGARGNGCIENLSLSGLMLRTPLPLEAGRTIGCEFSLFGSTVIDVPAVVISRIGDLYGVRFEPGPLSRILIEEAMDKAMATGLASLLTVHETAAGRVMRIAGGLCGGLKNDFMHSLKIGIAAIDVSGVTAVDAEGLALCREAQSRYAVAIGPRSECFDLAWGRAG